MKIFALSSLLTYSAMASAATVAAVPRFRRDVSELLAAPESEYLPPAAEVEATTLAALSNLEEVNEPSSAVLGDQGYEYRTVRRLKFRQRRDVSHLPQHYLPPPSKEYLPPAEAPTEPEAESVPADVDSEVIDAAEPKLAKEYLPPQDEALVSTEQPATEAAVTEAAPAVEEEDAEPRVLDVPQDSAILLDDGYHYKQPEDTPADLKEANQPNPEYLPPANDIEGPEESAVLAKDGYHYRRAVKRFRF